ncbi:TNFAIP3-interacting protein 2 isoform X1 [Ambystoma mexicanum]|uniref:TNFAIP3-interacting protein 2 isoform X1 n=1 Tax=Ambystoma mexicanum TaxID=8296 RepID=UPI0037E84190
MTSVCPSDSSSSSTDPLLARFKQLEETVERLHGENRALKGKMQSYNTLCTFYHEARQQLGSLQAQLAVKDKVIEGLRRETPEQPLGGAAAHSLVEGLMEQLSAARERLVEAERSSAHKMEALTQELQKLRQQVDEKERHLQEVACWPQHKKELEILQLQRTLANQEKVQATSEVLCRSLTEETHHLQRKLTATAAMCQQLVTCLEDKKRSAREPIDDLLQTERSNKLQFPDGETAHLQGSICKLQEENRALKQKLIHVEDLNAKWQKYDASREVYVKALHLQLKGLKSQAAAPTQGHAELLQKEILRLNQLLDEKMKEHQRLKRDVEEAMQARVRDSERLQILEQQVLVYKDDFTSERADRERAQSRILELLDQISRLQHHVGRPQDSRHRANNARFQIGNNNHMRIERDNVDPLLGANQNPLGSRSQAIPSQQAGAVSASESSSSERCRQGDLQCPHCLILFGDQQSEDFLKHISDCCE